MVGFWERLFNRDKSDPSGGSGKMAKDRLQFVLVQDRINLPADELQSMKREILEVIAKYVTVDSDNVDFVLSNRERDGLLIAEIPFKTPTAEDPTSEKHTEHIKPDEAPEVSASISADATPDTESADNSGDETTSSDEA